MVMKKIANIEISNRPREKALINGIYSLTDQELLAIFIRCGTKEASALDIADLILKQYDSLSNIFSLDIYDLMKIKGIKKAKAIEMIAVVELARRISIEKGKKLLSIKDAQDVYELFKPELESKIQENFIVIYLNLKLKILKKETLFIGGENSALIDINLMFKRAIKCGAKKLICIHNHPSGDPFPSKEDVDLTNKIRNISKVVNIELLDHVIIGKNDYFSFKQMNI